MSLPSPCISICRMEETTGGETSLCTGCLRTIGEIAAWAQATDEEKSAIWQRIGERREKRLSGTRPRSFSGS